jgi:hypothetical protein
MKRLFVIIFMLFAFTNGAYALPACVGSWSAVTWNNCQGTYTFPSGEKYVGEFKDDKANGQGTYTYASGTIKEGIFKDDVFQYAKKGPSGNTQYSLLKNTFKNRILSDRKRIQSALKTLRLYFGSN